MIRIQFFQKPEKGTLCLTMGGHSGTAPRGQDLICGAATMVCYTVAQALKFFQQDGKLKRPPKIRIRDGKATIIATPTEAGYAQVLNAFWVAQCGAMVLANNYPEHIALDCIRIKDQVS